MLYEASQVRLCVVRVCSHAQPHDCMTVGLVRKVAVFAHLSLGLGVETVFIAMPLSSCLDERGNTAPLSWCP